MLSRFGDRAREFFKGDGKKQYFVLLNPKNLDMFMCISIHEEKRSAVSFDFVVVAVPCTFGYRAFMRILVILRNTTDASRQGPYLSTVIVMNLLAGLSISHFFVLITTYIGSKACP